MKAIKLYGSESCRKTQHYKTFLETQNLDFEFLDVVENEDHAEELRSLYENRKLNFPTITIKNKKLRNPKDEELIKWINKMIPEQLEITHDKENNRFTLDINGEIGKVDYTLKDNKMYLVHSEVPYNLRGRGIGKVLVEKTFEQLTKEGYEAVAVCSYIRAVAGRSQKWSEIIKH